MLPKLPKLGKTSRTWLSDRPIQRPAFRRTARRPWWGLVGLLLRHCLIGAHDGVFAVDVLAGDGSSGDDVMAAPTVIGAVAVGSERSTEIGNGKQCHLAAQSGRDHQLIEVLEGGTQLAQQGRKALGLGIMGVEPPSSTKKTWRLTPRAVRPQ